MRALVHERVVRFDRDFPDPVPAEGECLLEVHLAGICATDLEITRGYMGFRGVLGHEMVGTVIAGSSAWRGKRVVCEINCVCQKCDMCLSGLAAHCRKRTVIGIAGHDGCFADQVAVPERNLHLVPDSVSDEEAVFVEPLAAAFQVNKQCPIEPRMNVAVVGSGRLGLLVAQVLAGTGCTLEVFGRNKKTLLLCEKKGIMSRSTDGAFARHTRDVVVECSGAPGGLDLALELVRPRGTVVLKSTYAGGASLNLAPAVVGEVKIVGSRCGPFPEAIQALVRKQIDVLPMLSKTFPIERGLEALDAAADPEHVKILLKINPRSSR